MADPWATLRRAAGDRQSGAAEIAGRAAEALAELDGDRVRRGIELLLAAHPAMAPLWRLASEVLDGPTSADGAGRFVALLDRDMTATEVAADVIPPWVLTISYSSSVLQTVRRARVRLLTCMESEPGGEGRRTAEAASEWGLTRVMSDEEALRLVPAAAVLAGADAVSPGGLVNKVKTRALAEAARRRVVPCYAVVGETKFAPEPLPVEESFELVPLELFEGIATPWGLLSPAEAEDRARSAPLHPDLRPMLERLMGRSFL